MSGAFGVTGLWMLALLAVLIISTGLPVWVLLIGCASLFALAGLLVGAFDAAVLNAVSSRTLGLLETDLLQALPLFVLIGVLLQRLFVADALFMSLAALFRRTGAGTSMAAFGVGTLVAPMNGSVASSAALLARLVAPRLGHVDATAATALISASATIGVVVPPSLVLILLGDTMLRAHIEASNLPGYVLGTQRIIGTHDVFHAAVLPATCVLLLWLAMAWWQGRRYRAMETSAPVSWFKLGVAVAVTVATLLLLAGVYLGKIYAVEAAATGAAMLLAAGLATRALSWAQWRLVLVDTLNLSGALLALLVGATAFSLVFRLWGTDQWIARVVLGSPLEPVATAALVLLVVALCAWVLDAFEMIFVIIPIVAPLLILLLGDAQQTAVLLLLLLQLGFLIPPLGYAVMMARSSSGLTGPTLGATLRAVLPYVLAQCSVTVLVFLAPALVHQLDAPADAPAASTPLSPQEVERRMREMSEPR